MGLLGGPAILLGWSEQGLFGEGVALDPTLVGVLPDLATVVNITVSEKKVRMQLSM